MLKQLTPLAFVLLWIVPVGWVGLMRSNYPLYPTWIAPLFRVSGIFETAPRTWRIFFIEVRNVAGWHQVDEKSLFASTPLGDRSRFQQLMNEIEDVAPTQAPDILEWIARQPSVIHSSGDSLKAIRIVQYGVPSETFLECLSLSDVYPKANALHLPRQIVASLVLRDAN